MKNTSDLRDRADYIMRLMEQRDGIALEMKAAFEAAASAGYNAKAMKKAIKIASMDAKQRAHHESKQSDLFVYLAELEGTNQREAA
jgi:uncharacterized protein (UPF0335 family)